MGMRLLCLQSAGGFHDRILEVCVEVPVDVTGSTQDIGPPMLCWPGHPRSRYGGRPTSHQDQFASTGLFLWLEGRARGFIALKAGGLPVPGACGEGGASSSAGFLSCFLPSQVMLSPLIFMVLCRR